MGDRCVLCKGVFTPADLYRGKDGIALCRSCALPICDPSHRASGSPFLKFEVAENETPEGDERRRMLEEFDGDEELAAFVGAPGAKPLAHCLCDFCGVMRARADFYMHTDHTGEVPKRTVVCRSCAAAAVDTLPPKSG